MFTNAPATSGRTRVCPKAKNANGRSVPATTSASDGGHRAAAARDGRRPAGHGDDERDERGRCHLERGDRDRVAAIEQSGLRDDEAGLGEAGEEHERVAGERPAAAGAGDQADAAERDREPEPRERPARALPGERRHHGDEGGHRAAQQRGVAGARPLEAGVLEEHHGAVAEAAPSDDAQRERGAQAAAGHPRERRGGESEAGDGEPGGIEPPERDLAERDGQPEQRAARGEREQRTTGGGDRKGHAHIFVMTAALLNMIVALVV